MTDTSDRLPRRRGPIGELRERWGWFVALGILFIMCGVIAFANLLVATAVSVYLIAALMIVGAVGQIAHALRVKDWGSFFFWLLSGVVYAAGGVFAFANPLLASAVLTLMLAAMLVAGGVLRIAVALQSRPHGGWGWVLAGGVLTALAGVLIAVGWPGNSLAVLGLFLAIDLTFQGWSYLALGLALRR